MSKIEQLQELLAWLHLPAPQKRRHYLEKHPESLAIEYEHALEVLVDLFADQPEEQKRLRIEQHVLYDTPARGGMVEAVCQAYIHEYGGVVSGLPRCLEEVEYMLSTPHVFRQSERVRAVAKMLLRHAIEYVQTDHSIPAEALAELQYQLGNLFAQDLPGQSSYLMTSIFAYYEAALLIYTRDRYPKQSAKVRAALIDMYCLCQAAVPW